jgi:hypothetical protein
VITGHFGSGKTELAINYALMLADTQSKVCLVDVDIVNPYFCSRDVKEDLDAHGIRLISANPSLSNAELMVIPPEVISIFNDKTYQVVVDVGGDDMGAVALGQYNRYFQEEPYEMYFVINIHRPLTSSQQQVMDYIGSIETASRLKVTHLISNANMSYETTAEDVLAGDKFVAELAKVMNIPHKYTVCRRDLHGQVEGQTSGTLFDIDVYMKTPWM